MTRASARSHNRRAEAARGSVRSGDAGLAELGEDTSGQSDCVSVGARRVPSVARLAN